MQQASYIAVFVNQKLTKMKRIATLLSALVLSLSVVNAGMIVVPKATAPVKTETTTPAALSEKMDMENFLKLTPKKVHEMTGRKMTFKEKIGLKLAQKKMKNHLKKGGSGSVPKGVYILLAFFGLAWIVMGIMDDWSGNNWWLNLILVLLFWLPGFIHALIVMNKYY